MIVKSLMMQFELEKQFYFMSEKQNLKQMLPK